MCQEFLFCSFETSVQCFHFDSYLRGSLCVCVSCRWFVTFTYRCFEAWQRSTWIYL